MECFLCARHSAKCLTCCVPGSVLNASHLMIIVTLWCQCSYYYVHFVGEETETINVKLTCLRSHSNDLYLHLPSSEAYAYINIIEIRTIKPLIY